MSEIWDSYLQGGQIMWFTIFQSVLIVLSVVEIFIYLHSKNMKCLSLSKLFLVISLVSTSFAYHMHILNRIHLLNDYLNFNRPPSREIIYGGNDQTLIFPNFEIWIVVLIVILLITTYLIEISNKKLKAE